MITCDEFFSEFGDYLENRVSSTSLYGQGTSLEGLHDKTILVFTPHPDDDVFGAGGTIALLNRNHNRVYIEIYTNDDKGSYDPEMSSQRLARIRKQEEEESEGMLGTPKQNISWMGYDDGMLEYAPQPKLVEEATAIIRRIRPDVLLSVDPGEWYERWHKTDHRMAAFNTIDAVRAAEFWLYFPNQKLQLGLEPYRVPLMYFFYPSPQEANIVVEDFGCCARKSAEPVFAQHAKIIAKRHAREFDAVHDFHR